MTPPPEVDTLLVVSPNLGIKIHGLCQAIVSGPEWLLDPVAREFAYHLADPEKIFEPDLVVELKLGMTGRRVNRFRGAAWQVEVSGRDQAPLKLVFRGNRLSRFIAAKWIVEPALRSLLTRKGFPPVHSTCLTDGKSGVVIAAGPAAGKTTLLLQWLSQGYPFLSDDYTILAPGKAIAYVTPLRLGARNWWETPKLRELPLPDQFSILARTAVRRLLLGKVKFAYKGRVDRIFPGIRLLEQVPLDSVVFLTPGAQPEPQELRAEDAADLIAAVDLQEMHGFERHLAQAGDHDHPQRLRHALLEIFQAVPCFEVGYSPGSRINLDQLIGKGK